MDLEYVSRDLAFAAQADAVGWCGHGDVKRWSLQEENMELCIWGSARLCPVCLPELLSGVHFFLNNESVIVNMIPS